MPLVRVADYAAVKAGPPGAFAWADQHPSSSWPAHRTLHIKVPYWDWIEQADGRIHSIPVVARQELHFEHSWWHEPGSTEDAPVLKPSLLCWSYPPRWKGPAEQARVEAWHGHLEPGMILKSCG